MKYKQAHYTKGQRVSTPGGLGRVAWLRMAPDCVTPAAVSVVLDSRKKDINYTGTVYLAELVTPISKDEEK